MNFVNFGVKATIDIPNGERYSKSVKNQCTGVQSVEFFCKHLRWTFRHQGAFSAVFADSFFSTGGVDMRNIKDFFAFEKIVAVGGSFMMKGDIVANCKKLMEVIAE